VVCHRESFVGTDGSNVSRCVAATIVQMIQADAGDGGSDSCSDGGDMLVARAAELLEQNGAIRQQRADHTTVNTANPHPPAKRARHDEMLAVLSHPVPATQRQQQHPSRGEGGGGGAGHLQQPPRPRRHRQASRRLQDHQAASGGGGGGSGASKPKRPPPTAAASAGASAGPGRAAAPRPRPSARGGRVVDPVLAEYKGRIQYHFTAGWMGCLVLNGRPQRGERGYIRVKVREPASEPGTVRSESEGGFEGG
jgi:hypothetical protein